MPNKQVLEEAFTAGFKHGYTNGLVGQLLPSDMETNAQAAYGFWWEENDPRIIAAFKTAEFNPPV